jgi:anti-sigma regulatory factor (Ser/Thr protein kinase)
MGRVGTEVRIASAAYQPEPKAAAAARRFVRDTLQEWVVTGAADGHGLVDDAVLLTSELVTNAVTHETGETITLVVTCAYGQLHVDVHDTSCALPAPVDGPPDAETGRGLMLVASLSSSWGYYRTPTGKAVYFTLAFQDGDLNEEAQGGPNGQAQGSLNGQAPSEG